MTGPRCCSPRLALVLVCLCASHLVAGRSLKHGDEMGGMHMDGGEAGSSVASAPALAPGPEMGTVGSGSANVDDPCYSDPSADACAGFNRTDADWSDDLAQLCGAAPMLPGCTLWEMCQSGTASGTYCSLASLTGTVCEDSMAATLKGCEAYAGLCSNATVVEQCLSPGPIPDALTTEAVKAGIEGICADHCMPGCDVCSAGTTFLTCSQPLFVFARQCYEMFFMPQCDDSGFNAFCANAEVAATFPAVCSDPPSPPDNCS